MSLLVPIRDKKMIIWNFMEELWSKYQLAIKNGQEPVFPLQEFRSVGLFENYLPVVGVEYHGAGSVILETLRDYEKYGYYKIRDDLVTLARDGLEQCKKSQHDWG
jgi:hypothetical protein